MKGKRPKEILEFLTALEVEGWEKTTSWTKKQLIVAYDKSIGKADTDMEYCIEHAIAHGAFWHLRGTSEYKFTQKSHETAKLNLKKILESHDGKKSGGQNE